MKKPKFNWPLVFGLVAALAVGAASGIYLTMDQVCECKVATQSTCEWPDSLSIIS